MEVGVSGEASVHKESYLGPLRLVRAYFGGCVYQPTYNLPTCCC